MVEAGPGGGGMRCTVFLCEDDRSGHEALADVLRRRAAALDGVSATVWRGIEGFGASGRLRAERLPDLARGLPLVLEVVGPAMLVEGFVASLHDLARGSLVTTEAVVLPAPAGLA